MVTRKAVPPASSSVPLNSAPYPLTPTTDHPSPNPSFAPENVPAQPDEVPLNEKLTSVSLDSTLKKHEDELSDWDDSDHEDSKQKGPADFPAPLNIRKSEILQSNSDEPTSLPAILQVNKPKEEAVKPTQPEKSSPLDNNDPYAQIEQKFDGAAASKAEDKKSTNPFLRNRSGEPNTSPAVARSSQPWPDYTEEQQANPYEGQSSEYSSPTKPPESAKQPPLIPVDAEKRAQQPFETPQNNPQVTLLNHHSTHTSTPSAPLAPQQTPPHPPVTAPRESAAAVVPEASSDTTSRLPQEPLPAKSVDRPQVRSNIQTPRSKVSEQRNEVYQIRHICWYDASYNKNPRHSSVLVQNANGPCPLLALVNALVLSTPPELITALVESLRTREQISLGFLLDAVFDELTSGRRGATAEILPDVGDLYSFLIALHTGMNVNPCFVPPKAGTPLSNFAGLHLQSSLGSSNNTLGCFEETREMRLYSTFAIPLIHGWLPEEQEAARAAFDRAAQSYEDAQNIQFREEELERKLSDSNLSWEDQALFMDLTTIKQFLSAWPTQLTEHGLDVMRRSLKPGQIAILFRNDHFSTLYKEPKSGQLMTLVTDAGYISHDEIIWENLVDISGTGTEMFSGDFRSVSHGSSAGRDQGWTTVEHRGRRKTQPPQQDTGSASQPRSSQPVSDTMPTTKTLNRSEQEDHDLALAMQLQEEEEERERNQQAARRRENAASERFLNSDHPSQRPQIPPRRSQGSTNNITSGEDDGALPTYEQAAASRPFNPSRGGPASGATTRRGGMPPQQGRGNSAAGMQRGGNVSRGRGGGRRVSGRPLVDQIPSTPFDGGRRRHDDYAQENSVADRREGCVVM